LLVPAGPAPAAAQSMERDGYVLPPESVQELFRRDKTIADIDTLSNAWRMVRQGKEVES